jgi:hypothetical protein
MGSSAHSSHLHKCRPLDYVVPVARCFREPSRTLSNLLDPETSPARGAICGMCEAGELKNVGVLPSERHDTSAVTADKKRNASLHWPNAELGNINLVVIAIEGTAADIAEFS